MIVVRALVFQGDSVQIEYMDPDRDVRSGGNTWLHSTVVLNAADERWKDEVDEALEAATSLVSTVLAIHHSTPPGVEIPEEDDDDDDDD